MTEDDDDDEDNDESVNKCVVTEVDTEVAGLKHYLWTSEIWQYMHIWRPSWIFLMNIIHPTKLICVPNESSHP